jgi:hypothetical protein
MTTPRIPAALAQLLASMAGAGHRIEIIPIHEGVDMDAFMAEFIEQRDAEHRKECEDCAAAYAAEQKKAAHDAEAVMKKARDMANTAGEIVGVGIDAAPRQPIGYMVFTTFRGETRPAPGSFAVERNVVEEKLAKFVDTAGIQKMLKVAEIMEVETPVHEVRPVFGE